MKQIIRILIAGILITLASVPSEAAVLYDNANVNVASEPFYVSGTCYWQTSTCVTTISNSTKNGQIITVDNTWGLIESIAIPYRRQIYDAGYQPATITLRVYTATTNNPATASLYLWDSVTLNPTNTYLANINFNFDSEIPVHSAEGYQTVFYLFIELQETYPDIDYHNPLYYGYYKDQTTDMYAPGTLYQWDGSQWTTLRSHYSPQLYHDMAFKLYGTFFIPPTPQPTPTGGTPIMTPGDTPKGPGDTPPPFPIFEGYEPEFSNGTDPLCGNGTSLCNGTLPSDRPGIGQESLPGGTLISIGYDFNNDGRITVDEAIDFLYDFSLTAFIISWLGIFVTRRSKSMKAGTKRGWLSWK